VQTTLFYQKKEKKAHFSFVEKKKMITFASKQFTT